MVSVDKFYGPPTPAQLKIENVIKKNELPKKTLPLFLSLLFGPSRTWKIFKKQVNALEFASENGNGLMTFAFQHTAGERSFLVCHPTVLWYVFLNRPLRERCSYEVIPESTTCKLYLDLEFEYQFNQSLDFRKGEDMVQNIITIFKHFLMEELNIDINIDSFLDLDSSSVEKFSRHIILNMEHIAFADNHTVGNVVRATCLKIEDFLLKANDDDLMYDLISKPKLQELFVLDRKGGQKIFVDLSVYSKNRHFRLLGSTKLFKNTPLVVSKTNKFFSKMSEDHSTFLCSLITYFDSKLGVLHYGCPPKTRIPCSRISTPQISRDVGCLETFILQMIKPNGRIRQISRTHNENIKYDIVGFRYCNNIQREHRSNNIFYIVDLKQFLVFQQCYDPECKGYMSNSIPIPSHLQIPAVDDNILLEAVECILSDDEIIEMINSEKEIFHEYYNKTPFSQEKFEIFPDMNLSDHELLEITSFTEEVGLTENESH